MGGMDIRRGADRGETKGEPNRQEMNHEKRPTTSSSRRRGTESDESHKEHEIVLMRHSERSHGLKEDSRGKRDMLICVVAGNGNSNDDMDNRLGDTTKTNQQEQTTSTADSCAVAPPLRLLHRLAWIVVKTIILHWQPLNL